MSTYLPWLADVLRAAGLTVVEHPGWTTRGAAGRAYPAGGFATTRPALIWHHDASAPGDSPTVPASMLARWATAAAQLWVARDGTWHVLAGGVAWQTGAVLPGMPDNWHSLGVETDHTTGEDWPPELLNSLRRGSAAILARLGHPATALHFHRTICAPPGRKVDPAGLDLAHERAQLTRLMHPTPPIGDPMPPPSSTDLAAAILNAGPIGDGPDVVPNLRWAIFRMQSEAMRHSDLLADLAELVHALGTNDRARADLALARVRARDVQHPSEPA